MFLPVKYYHCRSFRTMVQTGPSLHHPDLGQLLYTTCRINKKFSYFQHIISRLSHHVHTVHSLWAKDACICLPNVPFSLTTYITQWSSDLWFPCYLGVTKISSPKYTCTVHVQGKFLHMKVWSFHIRSTWRHGSKLSHFVPILFLSLYFDVMKLPSLWSTWEIAKKCWKHYGQSS